MKDKCPECGNELETMLDGEEVCKECSYYRWDESYLNKEGD